MRKIFCIIVFAIFAFGDVLKISDFEVDIFSKMAQNSTKKISLNLELVGTDLNENEAYVLDSLNIIIGSFYAEDLLTSVGKEKFKDTFKKYTLKKHSVDIDNVLILSLRVVNDLEIQKIIDAIRTKNLCGLDSTSLNKSDKGRKNEIIISPNLNNINQRPIDLNSIELSKDY